MAFLAPVAAELGGWTVRRFLRWVLLAAIGLILGAALWAQTMRVEAARREAQGLEQRLQMADADTTRWRVAARQRDDVIRDQAGQLARLRADAAAAAQIADQAEALRRQQLADLTQQITQMKVRAHAHPDQVRPLGPIVTDVLGSLRREADGAATPAAGD